MILVDPAAIGPLPFREGRRDVRTPVVFNAVGVDHFIDPQEAQTFGHGVVVVVKAPLRVGLGHAGIFVDRVMFLDPLVGFVNAWVILADAAVDHALDAGVGHAAVTEQAAAGQGVGLSLASASRAVDKTAVVDLAGPRLVVVFALEV